MTKLDALVAKQKENGTFATFKGELERNELAATGKGNDPADETETETADETENPDPNA